MRSLITLALLVATALVSHAQEVLDEQEAEATTASEADVKALLARFGDALETKDAMPLSEVLAAMSDHDNPEFLELAFDGLRYSATNFDKRESRKQAEEIGEVSKKGIDEFIHLRESEVQVAAAHVLANHPEDKSVTKALAKAYGDKKTRKNKPAVTAAVIHALGKVGYEKAAKDIAQDIEQAPSKEVARAAVRYFGQIKTKDYSIVRKLCELLDAPEPGNVNSPTNPPSSYWAAKWEVWSWTRRDVTWSLKQITGQVFRPAEGEHESDSRKALEYVKENKRELGLR